MTALAIYKATINVKPKVQISVMMSDIVSVFNICNILKRFEFPVMEDVKVDKSYRCLKTTLSTCGVNHMFFSPTDFSLYPSITFYIILLFP